MMVCNTLLLLVTFLAATFTTVAVIQNVHESSSSPIAKYVQTRFGLARGGTIEIDFEVAPKFSDQPNEAYVLILLVSEKERLGFYDSLVPADGDLTNGNTVANLCIQPSLVRIIAEGSGSYNLTIGEGLGDGLVDDLYSVILLQCRAGYSSNPVDIYVRVEMKNPRPHGDGYSHLSIHTVNYLRIFSGEGILYMILILGLLGQLFLYRSQVRGIHWLFALTLGSAFLVAMLEYNYYALYDDNGTQNKSAQLGADILYAIADTFGLSTIFLLSLGWTLLRSQLTERESKLVSYAILGYFVFAMGSAVCTDSYSTVCAAVSLVSFILRNLVLLAIIVAMNFTVTHLRILLTHSPWVPSTPIQYARCKQYQIFRLVYILYLFMPTIIYIIQNSMFTWREDWVVVALNEMTTLAMFFFIGVTFSPLNEVMLLRAFDGSINAVQQ